MRKRFLLLVAIVALTAAGAAASGARPAAAASQTVKISAAGYTPASVSITVGDSVVFANSDTAAHTVVFKQTTGFTCSSSLPLVVAPGGSGSCTFSTAGKYSFSDPAHKGSAFHGTVTVAKPVTAAPLTLTPALVVYGGKTTLSGVIPTLQAGQSVQVLGTECGTTSSKLITSVTTGTAGKFSYAALPLKQTAYAVKIKNATSPTATVKVKPRLSLRKLSTHHYAVSVIAAQTFAGELATFQRYRSTVKRWVTVKSVLLQSNTTGKAPTIVTSAKFRSSIKTKLRVRVMLGQKQVGACYAPGRSNMISS